jgi:hypothetical protein
MRKTGTILFILLLALSQVACAPKVGTEKWCEMMQDKPKADWSANDAKAFASHCVFKNYVDEED